MRIAIFSDIHGNLPAVTAVLADVEQQHVHRLYCLGDLYAILDTGTADVRFVRSADRRDR